MFLLLNHQNLDIYKVCRTFVFECYKATSGFPPEEKYALVSQIRRASTSVLLDLAEGSSRKSKAERVRFYEVSRGSLVEIDAALEIANELGYLKHVEFNSFGVLMKRCFDLRTALINSGR